MPNARPGVLYVSYDGILEPLGESQVVSYLERLSADFAITLLSYEKPHDLRAADRLARMRARLAQCGIRWTPLRYHRRPPVVSTLFDVMHGLARVLPSAASGRVAIVHARSYVPALIGLAVKRLTGAKFLFDMRGFWVDEKADTGQWRRGGALYRLGKFFERRFLAAADGIVSLTHRGVQEFAALGLPAASRARVEVIPTCTDLARFQPRSGRSSGDRAFVVGCVGTLSNWYLREQTLDYLAWLAENIQHAEFLMVTREDHARLRADAEAAGIPAQRLTIRSAEFAEMPGQVRRMDLGVFFIRPCFSKLASAATKLGEFMASGVPVVINDGIGDSGEFVRRHRVGLVLPDVTRASFEANREPLRALLADADVARRCREAAGYFSLERGVDAYRTIYNALSGNEATPAGLGSRPAVGASGRG